MHKVDMTKEQVDIIHAIIWAMGAGVLPGFNVDKGYEKLSELNPQLERILKES